MNKLKEQIQEVVNVYKSGDLSLAESHTKELINKNPNIAFLYNLLGLIFMSQKKTDSSIKAFEEGMKIDPKFAMIYNNLGLIYFNKKTHDSIKKAEKFYNKAIDLNDKIAEPYTNLGNLKNYINNTDEAINCHKKAININPNFSYAYLNLANIYIEVGKFDEAKGNLTKSIELNSNLSIAHRTLSRIIKYSGAEDHFNLLNKKFMDTSINESDKKMDYAFALGKAHEDMKNYKESFKFYELANDIYRKRLNFSIDKTRNDFINIKKTFNTDLFNKFKNQKNNDKKSAIFILGMPRSCTTLVEQIVSSHSKVFGAGEVNFIPELLKSNFGSHDINLFLKGAVNFNNNDLSNIGNEYISKMKHISNGKNTFTDKLPINFFWVGFIKLILPNSKIIHCYRNPKDNIFSIYKNHFPESKIDFGYNLNELIEYYNYYADLMKHWNSVLPNEIFNIKYESLISNPDEIIKNLIKFCDLKWENSCLNFHKNKRSIKTASDTQARKKLYKTSINSWKNYELFLNNSFENLKL